MAHSRRIVRSFDSSASTLKSHSYLGIGKMPGTKAGEPEFECIELMSKAGHSAEST